MMIISCRKMVDFLDDYVEGNLPAAQRKKFERHLKICPSCKRYLESYRQTLRCCKDALKVDDADYAEMPEQLVSAILDAARTDQN